MTTPLEAQELAKRLLALAAQIDPCLIGGPDARLLTEAAAFLEHPVNTGQGVTEEEVERVAVAINNARYGTELWQDRTRPATLEDEDRSTQEYARRLARAALAARTPLASVEGEWCPDWTLSDQDKTAVALTLALSKHIPDWPGATDDQLADVAKAVLSALAQSGRSSAEPAEPAEKHWYTRFFGADVRRMEAERDVRRLKADMAELRRICTARIEELEATSIPLTKAEIQSGHNRVQWAEDLIRQLPTGHNGRDSWLLNFGPKEED